MSLFIYENRLIVLGFRVCLLSVSSIPVGSSDGRESATSARLRFNCSCPPYSIEIVSFFRRPTLLSGAVLTRNLVFSRLVLPLITREIVSLLHAGGNASETQDLSTYGFLYGTFPAAPGVFVFATQYSLEVDLVSDIEERTITFCFRNAKAPEILENQ